MVYGYATDLSFSSILQSFHLSSVQPIIFLVCWPKQRLVLVEIILCAMSRRGFGLNFDEEENKAKGLIGIGAI